MADARIVAGGDRPAIRLERRLADPPPVVWRALTRRDELRAWFPCDVVVDGGTWVVGASISFPFPRDLIEMTLTGEVLEVDEPYVLAFTWGEETLCFRLTPDGDGTLLELTNELPPAAAARNAAGWDECLDRLAGIEAATNGWQARFEAYAVAFSGPLGPQSGPPPGTS